MATVHLIEGPVGSGKSTFTAKLGKDLGVPRFILDEWMTTLFSPDRPETGVVEWYIERKRRVIDQIWNQTVKIVDAGTDVILELGLIQQADRLSFIERVDCARCNLVIYVLDAPRDVRRERVRSRNKNRGPTFWVEVPDHVFELASDMWQPIDESECGGYELRFISEND